MRLLVLLLLIAGPALAQPACDAPGTRIPVQVSGPPLMPRGARASATVYIPTCQETETRPPDPPEDILHGPPAPDGLLRGEGPKNILTNRYEKSVTISP